MSTAANVETHEFQAETRRLLDLVIHSLYTHKEIFLRELISNASDAIDRLRFEALTSPDLAETGWEPEIRLAVDRVARTLTISDNGIGMSRDEVIQNIGSIAKSGTREMLEAVKARKDGSAPPELIGNFGVGFYSAFMAADKVRLVTRRAGSDEAVQWESRADGVYTLQPGERRTHGTTITLELKPVDAEGGIEDYTDEYALERIIKRYSDFIAYPIRMKVSREEKETDENGIVTPDGKSTIVTEDKLLNAQKPLWARSESEADEQEYRDFYKDLTGDWEDPLLHFAYKAEGVSEYQALVYVPKSSPQDLYLYGSPYGLAPLRSARDDHGSRRGAAAALLALPARRGRLGRPAAERLAPDASGEPAHRADPEVAHKEGARLALEAAGRRSGKVLGLLEGIRPGAQGRPDVGVLPQGQAGLAAAVRDLGQARGRAHHAGRLRLARMPEGQNDIFYLTAESRALCESSPLLEAFKEKGWEVLYFVDPVDEIVVEYLPEFEGKRLKSAAKGDLDLGEKKDIEAAAANYKDMLGALQGKLDEWIKSVRLSSRLTSSPACLASDEHDMSPTMERMMRMSGGELPRQKRILELNAKHEIVRKLQERYEKDANDPILADYAELLYGYAALAEGSELPDPVRFNQLLASLMARGA
ncbi:MAG: molecular chaperone HtpG [Bryobacterales bacterium]